MDYLKEKDIVFRVFNESQEYPKKQEQFSEILASVYSHYPQSFVKDYSSCVYTVIGHKGSGKEIDNLIRFIATATSRCCGDATVPQLAPLLIEVALLCIVHGIGLAGLHKGEGSLCEAALFGHHQPHSGEIEECGHRRNAAAKDFNAVSGEESRQGHLREECRRHGSVSFAAYRRIQHHPFQGDCAEYAL